MTNIKRIDIDGIVIWDFSGHEFKCNSTLISKYFNLSELICETIEYYKQPDTLCCTEEIAKLWYTGISFSDDLMLCIKLKEISDIDKNTKWFYDGKQVYPVEN